MAERPTASTDDGVCSSSEDFSDEELYNSTIVSDEGNSESVLVPNTLLVSNSHHK